MYFSGAGGESAPFFVDGSHQASLYYGVMPDVLRLTATFDRPTLPAKTAAELKLLLQVESLPGLVIPPAKAMTTNICLVFDCSGSMAGKKRDTAIEAAQLIVDTVSERHRLSLVGFATRARVLLDNVQPIGKDKAAIKAKIDKAIRGFPRGTTNLAAGLEKATSVLDKHKADAKVMIILSDGGADSEKKALAAGAAATAGRAQLFAVGIGEEYDADALLKLVTPSNGSMFGESDLERIKATFEMLIGRIDSFVATNASLRLTFASGVSAGTAYRSAPDHAVIGKLAPDARSQASLSVGNVEKDRQYAFLVSVAVPSTGPGQNEVARAELLYDAPALGLRKQKVERSATVDFVRGEAGGINAEVVAAFRAVQFVELAEAFAAAQRRGDVAASIAVLRQLMDRAQELGDADGKLFYEDVLAELNERGKISQERINAVVVGTTLLRKKKAGPRVYDVVLLDAGEELITVIRELRRITRRPLQEVSDLVKAAPKPIKTLPLAEARALKKELQDYGARIEVRERLTERAPEG